EGQILRDVRRPTAKQPDPEHPGNGDAERDIRRKEQDLREGCPVADEDGNGEEPQERSGQPARGGRCTKRGPHRSSRGWFGQDRGSDSIRSGPRGGPARVQKEGWRGHSTAL